MVQLGDNYSLPTERLYVSAFGEGATVREATDRLVDIIPSDFSMLDVGEMGEVRIVYTQTQDTDKAKLLANISGSLARKFQEIENPDSARAWYGENWDTTWNTIDQVAEGPEQPVCMVMAKFYTIPSPLGQSLQVYYRGKVERIDMKKRTLNVSYTDIFRWFLYRGRPLLLGLPDGAVLDIVFPVFISRLPATDTKTPEPIRDPVEFPEPNTDNTEED
jgi:hypothetical protein